ncbi:MAG TPA: sucrase ferredoxin [Acidimicrobiia bacterium]|nr:sucrase ferredoxin [Acidimicrobiia bacterium]
MTLGRPRCSAEAVARHEPLHATASLVSAWLLIEQPGAWGPDALTESGFPAGVAAELQRRASGVRILLIRHRETSRGGPTFFIAHSGGDGLAASLVSAPLTDPEALLELDLQSLAAGELWPGNRRDDPIYLVCTHGRHDICCADRGRPLYRAMSEVRPERAWEVSHIGGDRFAGNLLVLPRGDYFGRLEPEDAGHLVADYEEGRLDLAHHRGRSIRPRLVQAAEHFLRVSESLTGLDDLTVVEYRRSSHGHAEVVFSGPGEIVYRVEVAARESPTAEYLTWRAQEPGRGVAYDLLSLTQD